MRRLREYFGKGSWRALAVVGLVFGSLWGLGGCAEPMPEGRGAPSQGFVTPTQRDVGQEIYNIIRREAQLHPTLSAARTQGVDTLNTKWDLPATINAILPASSLSATEAMLRSLLPFYDDLTLPKLTREGAEVLKELAASPNTLRALVLAERRVGMFPKMRPGEGGFLLRILDFPEQKKLLQRLAEWWLKHDGKGLDGDTKASGERAVVEAFLNAAASWLVKRTPSTAKAENSLFNDALLLEDTRLDLNVGQRCMVRVDSQGNPILTQAGQTWLQTNGTLPPPFPTDPRLRGNCGEAVTQDGTRLYDIRALPKTVLGSLLRVGRELIVRDLPLRSGEVPFPFNMPVGVRPLLGDLSPTGTYTKEGPLMQSLRASVKLMKGPRLYEVLKLFARITEKEEKQLAATLSLFEQIGSLSNQYKTQVNPDTALFNDLLPFIQELVATPGMLEDLLKALQTPGTADKLKASALLLMRHTKEKILSADYESFRKGNKKAIFDKLVDFALPDRPGNRSLFQRMLHMLNDFNRLEYRSKIKALGGISIPFIEMRVSNMALAYLRSLIGKQSAWDMLYVNGKPIEDGTLKDAFKKSLPEMGLSENPTPEELAIFVNRELVFKQVPLLGPIKVDLTLEPVKCKEGYPVTDHHGELLLAGLASGLIGNDGGALKPIALVFDKYNKLDRLLDLFAVFHKHWGSSDNQEKTTDGKPTYVQPPSNLRSTEQLLIKTLEETELLVRLNAFGKILLELKLSDEPNAPKGITSFQRYLSYIFGGPGKPRSETPLGPLLDTFTAIDKALQGDQKRRARIAWESAIDALYDLLLQVEGKGDQAQFKNRRAPIVLVSLLNYLSEEVKKRDLAGQWAPDLSKMQSDLETLLTDPLVPRLFDLIETLVDDRVLLDLTTQLLTHALPDPKTKPNQFGEFLSLTATLLSPTPDDIGVPLGRFLGEFLSSRQGMLTRTMHFLQRALPLDTGNQLPALMGRSVAIHETQNTLRAAFMLDLMKTMWRQQPNATAPLGDDDYSQIFQRMGTYLLDGQHGVEKLYQIIQQRNGPTNTGNQ